jgi:hypothetical protein
MSGRRAPISALMGAGTSAAEEMTGREVVVHDQNEFWAERYVRACKQVKRASSNEVHLHNPAFIRVK